ncbi:MAG: DUF421 domain-containing protein [Ruthenibacterium sp.]
MALIVFRTVLIYILIIIAMRLMGKKQLGELQPSELVSTILISNLASISIESPDFPLLGSILPVFIIVAFEILLSALCVKSHRAAKLVSGSPRVVIVNGVIDQKMLADLRYTVDDLLEALREKDVFELSEVSLALVETNGTVSVQRKFSYNTPTNQDLEIAAPKASQPSLPMVTSGMLNRENMALYQIDDAFIQTICTTNQCALAEVLLLFCNDAKETTLIKKESG